MNLEHIKVNPPTPKSLDTHSTQPLRERKSQARARRTFIFCGDVGVALPPVGVGHGDMRRPSLALNAVNKCVVVVVRVRDRRRRLYLDKDVVTVTDVSVRTTED